MTENLITTEQFKEYMNYVVSLSGRNEIDEDQLNIIIEKVNLLINPIITFENSKRDKNGDLETGSKKDLLYIVFSALTVRTILEKIHYITSQNKKEEVKPSGQNNEKMVKKIIRKQASEPVRLLIAAMIYQIKLDGEMKLENNSNSSVKSLSTKYISENIIKPEKFSWINYLQENFFQDDKEFISKLGEKNIAEIQFGIDSKTRSYSNWVDKKLPIYFYDLLFSKSKNQNRYKFSFPNKTTSIIEESSDIDILDTLRKPHNDYSKEIDFNFRDCLIRDGMKFSYNELLQFSGTAILVSPIKGGKTHLLKQLPNLSNLFVYIDYLDMSVAKEFDTRRFLSNRLVLESDPSIDQKFTNISRDQLSKKILLFDNFDLLSTPEQIVAIYQLSLLPNTICATTLTNSDPFFFENPITHKSLNPIILKISSSAGNLGAIFQESNISNQAKARLESLSFIHYPGGMDFLSDNIERGFSEIINGFFDFAIFDNNPNLKIKDLQFLLDIVKKKIYNDLEISMFGQFYGSAIRSNDPKYYIKFDSLLEDFYIPLDLSEEDKLICSLETLLCRKLIIISNHQLKFQYNEFLWIILINVLKTSFGNLDFLAAQYGYRRNRTIAWAFFLDYFDKCAPKLIP
ncbi:MAG: hypothetical protein C0412_13195 [Flavobacterium sp.]|nr:hypothetical protein [Flavobacterium sp.]